MRSRDSFPLQGIDLLIAQALQSQTEGAEPRPCVWRQIRQRARMWSLRHQPPAVWGWNAALARMPEADLAFSMPVVIRGGLVAWKYDLAAMRFLDYAGMMFRFGW